MRRWQLGPLATAIVALLLGGAAADEPTIGHKPTTWERPDFAKRRPAADKLASGYKSFLTANKTEREVIRAAISAARKKGHRDLFAAKRPTLRAGSRVYAQVHGKLAALVLVGKRPVTDGVHVVAAHIDSVRIDLKQNPIYADGNVAMLETHYYGGIKAYQWLSVPLELRGVVIKKDGTRIDISIGADPRDPVFVIPDIAAHLRRRVDRTEGEELPAEKLDPIVASTPGKASGNQDRFAAEAARLLRAKYKIEVADLASAELALVPAGGPRDVGIDRGLIGGYGQDDRACAYAALRAILDADTPDHTAIVVLVDREETGSAGNTGARSVFVRRVVAELLEATGTRSTEAAVNRSLTASMVFSADVTGAVHPAYPELYDRNNATFLGSGVAWNQSAVHAEVMAYARRLFDKRGIAHQPSTWTKVRRGGPDGATVLPYFTRLGMDGLDVSIPLLSMHAPFELISVVDLYEGYRAYRAFLED